MVGFAAEISIAAGVARGAEASDHAKDRPSCLKAMWKAVARSSKYRSFPRCRSTSTLAATPLTLSGVSSLSACDAAAVARLSQGAPSWFCINLIGNTRDEQPQASSYQESVSTIDSILCSLPVLTNHLSQSSPDVLSPSSSHNATFFQENIGRSAAYSSAAHAVATFDGATEVLTEQNLAAETLRLASQATTYLPEEKIPPYDSFRKTSIQFSTLEALIPDSSDFFVLEDMENLYAIDLPSLDSLATQNLTTGTGFESDFKEFSSVETLPNESSAATFEMEMLASKLQARDFFLELGEPVVRDASNIAECGEPCVSDSVLAEVAAQKEAAVALRRYNRKMRTRQRKMEMEASWKATLEYKNMILRMCKKNLAPNVPFVRGLLLSWFEPFRDALFAEQKAILEKEPSTDRNVYGPYLLQLPPDILAVVVMHKLMAVLMKEQEHGYVRLLNAATAVGEAVEQETEIFRIMSKKGKKRKQGEVAPSPADVALQMNVEKLMKEQNVRRLDKTVRRAKEFKPWGSPLQVKVGSRLIDILMNVAFIHPPVSQSPTQDLPEIRPALKHEKRTITAKKKRFTRQIGVLACDPLVWSSLEKSAKFVELPYMPMLVEPVKWTSYKKGGYMVLRSYLMRTHGARSQQVTLSRTPKANLRRVFSALDVLGRTPWRINTRVLDVVEKIWADGGGIANLIERADLELPKKPSTKDEDEIKSWRREFFRRKRINNERHSLRCDTELKLSVARKYKKESKFYYPHNVDFRGRAYPMHPNLNHLGSDLCRGLLEFGEGRPLGCSGLRWLKIHLANVFATGGVDKYSFEGRIAFVNDNIEDIMDSARRPLEGTRWWLKAEDPFQCLAACMSLSDALECDDLENFICYMPVHQDGSCNGLQHYAALGRDIGGAESVNLFYGEKPADVYSGIANRVRLIMENDALQDSSVADAEHARALVGHVDRKLVKQTVMTSVYGVTFIGARAQILNRLEEKDKDKDNTTLFSLSSYAAKVTLGAIGEIFKEAKGIMSWLADCAKLVASENEAVKWSSPLGLPIVQPYRRPGWKQVKTSLQTFRMRNDNDQPVFVQRQKTAFPPNFVHSLDSAHMMMTALACAEAGLTFAGVHDSYWTHASDVETMNRILREKFVELYNQPLLENLLESFQRSFPDVEFPPLPERGSLDMDVVLKSPYFFN